ncbi:porin [Haloferula chungangensis]|uniref:Porin n=1 Tax=Haloferula chungangensis TaxID=1048331 RepID=A0ABW2LD43_9BACT
MNKLNREFDGWRISGIHSGKVTKLLISAIAAPAGFAGTPAPEILEASESASLYDKIWGLATLYENDENPVIQKLAFTGRFQYDYATVQGDGSLVGGPSKDLSYEDFNTRRWRMGLKATLFEDFTLHSEADFDPDIDPMYTRLTDAYVGWSPNEAFGLKVGKQGMGFTLDGKTSSKELLTLERNALSGNLWYTYEYLPGVSVGGKQGNWHYQVGGYSQGEADKEFGEFNAGSTWMASLGYDLSEQLGSEKAMLALDYMYNETTPSRPALFSNRSFGQVISLNFEYAKDCYGLRTDLAHGDGFLGQPDVWGVVVMPYWDITDKLQAVCRYTYIDGDGPDSVRFNTQYDNVALNGERGNQYQEGYVGLNYYFYGNKLKIQTGLQYIDMQDTANNGGAFRGWNWTTGLRLSW